MSQKGKCLNKACLVYACMLIMISGVGFLISIGFLIYYWIMKFVDPFLYSNNLSVILGVAIIFGLPLKYSRKLAEGIIMKEPSKIGKYLLFGFITNIICFIITLITIKRIDLNGVSALLALAPNLIYTLLNSMVYVTYLKIKDEIKLEAERAAKDVEKNRDEIQNPTTVHQEPLPIL